MCSIFMSCSFSCSFMHYILVTGSGIFATLCPIIQALQTLILNSHRNLLQKDIFVDYMSSPSFSHHLQHSLQLSEVVCKTCIYNCGPCLLNNVVLCACPSPVVQTSPFAVSQISHSFLVWFLSFYCLLFPFTLLQTIYTFELFAYIHYYLLRLSLSQQWHFFSC